MKWSIPAKTFLVGEYAALYGHGAIVLTTKPFFELTLIEKSGLHGIHPESPAGKLWLREGDINYGLEWFDPYNAIGGLGASSAQFLGAFFAVSYLNQSIMSQQDMLESYWHYAWNGKGLRPSGYDLLAQSIGDVVYLKRNKDIINQWHWPFTDVGYILLHTGKKITTHEHLQTSTITEESVISLSKIVDQTSQAFNLIDSSLLVDSVNSYYQNLLAMNLVSEHSVHDIQELRQNKDIIAAKGCGALGADVLLLLVPSSNIARITLSLEEKNRKILATSSI